MVIIRIIIKSGFLLLYLKTGESVIWMCLPKVTHKIVLARERCQAHRAGHFKADVDSHVSVETTGYRKRLVTDRTDDAAPRAVNCGGGEKRFYPYRT